MFVIYASEEIAWLLGSISYQLDEFLRSPTFWRYPAEVTFLLVFWSTELNVNALFAPILLPAYILALFYLQILPIDGE